MSMQYNALRVARIQKEAKDSVSIYFEINHSLKNAFKFKPGQYVNLRLMIDGREERRSYSISTSPDQELIAVTVKKVQGGKVSTYLTEHLEAGRHLDVSFPEGNFTVKAQHELSRNHYMFSAGSGITPLMSMIKTLLEEEPRSVIYLLYGNRNEESIIFKESLDDLAEKYKDQLYVHYILSQPLKTKADGLKGIFKKPKTSWAGLTGRITPEVVKDFLLNQVGPHKESEYYICGPGNMISSVYDFLKEQGINKSRIHREYFTVDDTIKTTKANHRTGNIIVQLDQKKIETPISEKTILFTLLDAGHEPPYSCTNGTCSACMAKVIKGKITMDQCFALDDDEIEDGYILTCQSRLASKDAEITYDI